MPASSRASAGGQSWLALDVPVALSADGRYASYSVRELPLGSFSTTIRAVHGDWRKVVAGGTFVSFTRDSLRAVVLESSGMLAIFALGSDTADKIAGVSSAQLVRGKQRDWLAYQLTGTDQTLVLRDLANNEERRFQGVTKIETPDVGHWLLLHRTERRGCDTGKSLDLADVESGELITLCSTAGRDDKASEPRLIIDRVHEAMVWATASAADKQSVSEIWYFKSGMAAPEKIVSAGSFQLDGDGQLPAVADLRLKFAAEGKMVCFNLDPKPEAPRAKVGMSSVDVWSYRDPTVQSQQLALAKSARGIRRAYQEINFDVQAAVSLSDRRVMRLVKSLDDEEPLISSMSDAKVLVVRGHGGDPYEWRWNPASRFDVVLLSLKDGTEQVLSRGLAHWFAQGWALSPDGRYAVYFAPADLNWHARDLASGRDHNLTAGCRTDWTNYYLGGQEEPADRSAGRPVWLENGSTFLLYSRNDIWRVDLMGKSAPVNLTRRHTSRPEAVFRIAMQTWVRSDYSAKRLDSSIVVEVFDRKTKDEGFLRIQPDGKELDSQVMFQPAKLLLFDLTASTSYARGWLVSRQTAESSPNLYYTSDFETFDMISDVHPESAHHGLTAELLTWKTPSGRETQGVLYKPRDFDPTQKYPVIVEYYQCMSDRFNDFYPHVLREPGSGGLYPPSLTDRGYLVFLVDVLPGMRGQAGKAAYNAVISGAQLLATKPWVDTRHMGLRGQSFGAYETDYIVAHTSLFAAAVATSGWADFVSAYNGITYPGSGATRAPAYERGREWMSGTLWEFPDEYIENSPIFQANNVTTPMLLMNNCNDRDVNWWQGLEWFNALRRLGKRAWMLQYDNGGHLLARKEDRADFDRRMMQFYDHYLKGDPAPKWMTEGIPARLKGEEDGFDLDARGREP